MLLSTRKTYLISFLTIWFSAFAAFGQTMVYVTPTGMGNQSGSSWGNALPGTQLQPRLAAATAGTQFWVAGGRYKPTTGMDRNVSFSLRNNVEVYGGFVGTESTLAQRPVINTTTPSATTLSGDLGIVGGRNDNTYNLFRNAGLDASAILDGVVISDGAGAPFGGGMFNNGSGAGSQCSPTIRNCWFSQNTAEWGGAVSNYGQEGGVSNPKFTNCVFVQNRALSNHGGAVFNDAFKGNSSPTLTGCLFISNEAHQQGGAIANNIHQGTCDFVLTSCQFIQNTAISGGAVMIFNEQATSTPIVKNCVFTQNLGTSYGGAIYVTLGGACVPKLTNCTFTKNSVSRPSNYGAAIFGNYIMQASEVQLVNCLVRDNDDFKNGAAITAFGAQRFAITYSNIQGGFTGTGNIDADPLFVDPANGNFRLQPGSPSINTGDPGSTTANVSATDLAGNPRIDNNRIDMGAYERQTTTGPIVTLREGNWNDPTTWLFGQIPASGDTILIRHRVGMPASYVGNARTVQYDASGQLVFSPAARLLLN